MKKQNKTLRMKRKLWIPIALGLLTLASCETPMTFETEVHEDGTFDKAIIFEKKDSTILDKNIFGINTTKGWSVSMTKLPQEKTDNEKDAFRVKFNKHFNSVDEMNAALNNPVDTLFQIKSSFEKKFRWFYTYIRYSETFMPINRFKMLPVSDFFNQEDYQFIERLPSEGSVISKADSVYLQMLNIKIQDYYANMAIFNEQYDVLVKIIKRNNLGSKWLDTLYKKREFIYDQVDKLKGDPRFASIIIDTLQIPLSREKTIKDNEELSKDFKRRLDFMSFAKDGKYKNCISMPWQIVKTNADSVSGNKLFWRPLVNKFVITEYVMYAESRRLNIWTILVSGFLLFLSVLAWLRKSKIKTRLRVL